MKFATLMMAGAVGASTTKTIKVTKAYCLDSAIEYETDMDGYHAFLDNQPSIIFTAMHMSQLKEDKQTLDDCYKKHDAKTSTGKQESNNEQCKGEYEVYLKKLNEIKVNRCIMDVYAKKSLPLPSTTGINAPANPVCPKPTSAFTEKLNEYKNLYPKDDVKKLKDSIQKKTKEVATYQAFLNICHKENATTKT